MNELREREEKDARYKECSREFAWGRVAYIPSPASPFLSQPAEHVSVPLRVVRAVSALKPG